MVQSVASYHGLKEIRPDADYELGMAASLRSVHSLPELQELYRRFSATDAPFDAMMRRICLRAILKSLGNGLTVAPHVAVRHPETFEIGDGVFIGEQAILQGRINGSCRIGRGCWIGPQSFLDARQLVLGEYVGWGPGAKVLGSEHTGRPLDVPIIQTELEIRPVRVGDWADIGTNATILPGVTIGKGAIVGAGAVVREDVPEMAKVAGVPARIIGWRDPAREE